MGEGSASTGWKVVEGRLPIEDPAGEANIEASDNSINDTEKFVRGISRSALVYTDMIRKHRSDCVHDT